MIKFEKDEYCQITGWNVKIGKWDIGDAMFVPAVFALLTLSYLMVM
jgi:hypothetical protein